MAAIGSQLANNNNSNGFGGYDSRALKNYAAMSAMYWPGFDSAAGYAAAAYSQASVLAAAATKLRQSPTVTQGLVSSSSSMSTTPPFGATGDQTGMDQTQSLGSLGCQPHSTTPNLLKKK